MENLYLLYSNEELTKFQKVKFRAEIRVNAFGAHQQHVAWRRRAQTTAI